MLNRFNNLRLAIEELLGLNEEEPNTPIVQVPPEDYVAIDIPPEIVARQELFESIFGERGFYVLHTLEFRLSMTEYLRNPAPLRGPENREVTPSPPRSRSRSPSPSLPLS